MSDYESYVPKNVGRMSESYIRKTVKNVTHGERCYRIEFDKNAEAGPGVVMPDFFDFEPVPGMSAIWDAYTSMGAEGDLSFYGEKGELLRAFHRESAGHSDWRDDWSDETAKEKVWNKLMPIFKLRINELKKEDPRCRGEEQIKSMILISAAAQKFLQEYGCQEMEFENEDAFFKSHKEFDFGRAQRSEISLLVGSFVDDVNGGVIDKNGTPKSADALIGSVVMCLPHEARADIPQPSKGLTTALGSLTTNIPLRKKQREI